MVRPAACGEGGGGGVMEVKITLYRKFARNRVGGGGGGGGGVTASRA